MKILHLCLACFYIDNYTYQENILPRINHEDGHDVRIIASTETYVDNAHLGYVEPSEYVTEYGVPIKRLPYVKVGNGFVTHKLRIYPHLYEEIAAFAPDVVMCHDLAFGSVLDVIRYKKDHPQVKFYADTHTAAYNSGTNWLSLHILHCVFYRHLVQQTLPYLEKFFYIGIGEKEFAMANYGVPESLMEFYPLGGTLLSDEEYATVRAKRRAELGLEENDRLYIHSGKLDALKRSDELFRAFSAVDDPHAVLAVIGSIPEDRESVLLPLIEADNRMRYLGWKSGEELQEYLCAADLYCQPGSVSATMQNAICRNTPVMSYPHPAYTAALDCGQFFWIKTQVDMEQVFAQVKADPALLAPMTVNARRCAEELLDYQKLAARLYR